MSNLRWVKNVCFLLVAFSLSSVGIVFHDAHAESASDPAPQIVPGTPNGKKILFDNTHGQTAGAADWVIDGGFSDFADASAKKGYYVKELRKSTPITYDDLKDYNVLVIGEANIPYKTTEQAALLQFVQQGGSIFFIADHYNADRNKNRWDASEVFNGYRRGAYSNPAKGMTTEEANSQAMQGVASSDWLSDNFGVRFRYNALGDINANDVVSPEESFGITKGVSSVAMHAGATIAITDPTHAKGIVYLPKTNQAWANAVDQGVYDGGGREEGAFVAISKVGKGKAAFIGDSSPVEDATPKYLREETGTKKTTYDGFKEVDDGVLLTNVIDWLGKQEDYTSLTDTGVTLDKKTALLDMETPEKSTEPQSEPWSAPAAGYKWYDSSTFKPGSYGSNTAAPVNATYKFVHQTTLPNSEPFTIRVSTDGLSPGQTVSNLSLGIYLSGGTQVAQVQNADGTWPSSYGYSPAFSITADSTGHASKDLTVRVKSGTSGAASLRLKNNGNNQVTESVTIDNVDAEKLPADDIGVTVPDAVSIADARAVDSGKVVTVKGTVTSTAGAFGGKGFYLQDTTGGLYVYQNTEDVKPGDVVQVSGPVTTYNGEIEVSDLIDFKKVDTSDLPKALEVEKLSDSNQGQLVTLKHTTIKNLTPLNGAFEWDAVNGDISTHVRVDERTGVTYSDFTKLYNEGDTIGITGVSSVFKETYQLKPLSMDNFKQEDTKAPVISGVENDTVLLTDTYTPEWSVTDDDSGVASIVVTLDGKEIDYPVNISALSLNLGEHDIKITATDKAGNVAVKDMKVAVTIDEDHLDELLTLGYEQNDFSKKAVYQVLSNEVKVYQKLKNPTAKKALYTVINYEVKKLPSKQINASFAQLFLDALAATK